MAPTPAGCVHFRHRRPEALSRHRWNTICSQLESYPLSPSMTPYGNATG